MGKANNKKEGITMKLGFIGTGNMASAIMGGIIKNQIIPANDIIGADVMEAGRERVKEQFKIQATADNHEVINRSDIASTSSVAAIFSFSALLKSITRYRGTLFFSITAVPCSSTTLATLEKF